MCVDCGLGIIENMDLTVLPDLPSFANHFLKLWNSTEHRDSTGRLIQFASIFLAENASKLPGVTDVKEFKRRFNAMALQMALSRKAFRLFKFFNFYKQLRDLKSEAKKLDVEFLLKAIGKLCFIGFFVMDAYNYLVKIKFIKDTNAIAKGRLQNWFWLYALLSKLLLGVFALQKSPGGDKAMRHVFQCSLDVLLPLANLKTGLWYPSRSVMGLAGTITSLMTLQNSLRSISNKQN